MKRIVINMVELWGRISSRERAVLSIGVALTFVLIGYHFLVSPFVERFKVLDRLILQKENEIVELSAIRKEYLLAGRKISGVESRLIKSQEGVSLLSHVEGIAVRNQVKDRIVFIRPQPSQVQGNYRELAVELKVENITLPQLVNLLDAIEHSPQFLRVKRAQIKKRYNNPRLLDGTLIVASYERTS